MKFFGILGALDPEMLAIQAVLNKHGHQWASARYNGFRVKTHQAYSASTVNVAELPKDAFLISVECKVNGIEPDAKVDHHRPGDAGYGVDASKFLQGSSLGQVLRILELEPTEEHRYLAAADHCLTAAYAGQCPGIDPDKLRQIRRQCKVRMRNIAPETWEEQVAAAKAVLLNAPKIQFGDCELAWFDETQGDMLVPELSEASAQLGQPYVAIRSQNLEGRVKAAIKSADPQTVKLWMNRCGLKDLYGCPERGFAGGYF